MESFGGKVQSGKVCFDRPMDWTAALATKEGKRVVVTVEREQQTRSIKSNRRYFGLIVPLASAKLSKGRAVPLSKKQTHFILASSFGNVEKVEIHGAAVPVPDQTHLYTDPQFSDYNLRIEVWLAEPPDSYRVPEPGERYEVNL